MRKNKKSAVISETELLDEIIDQLADQKQEIRDEAKKEQQSKPKVTRRERRAKKKAIKALKKKAKRLIIPKTVQQTIPYRRVYPDSGVIETDDGIFTKSYILHDINYSSAPPEEKLDMLQKFGNLLNSLSSSSLMELTAVKQMRNLDEFKAMAMIPERGDAQDPIRKEQNEYILNLMRHGQNDLIWNRYLTVQTKADSYDAVLPALARLDTEIINNVKQIGGAIAEPMTSAQRLEVLHDIYNPDQVGLFGNTMRTDPATGKMVFSKEKFSFNIMRLMGLTSKDMIGPECFAFHKDYGKCGNSFFRSLYVRNFPTQSDDEFFKQLADIPCKLAVSVIYEPIDMDTSLKMVKTAQSNANRNMIEKQKTASRNGYSVELITPESRDQAAELEAIRDDLTNKNQKLFFVTVVITHFAESLEQLNLDTKAIQGLGRTRLMDIKTLTYQQSNGLDSCLPLCKNKLEIKRTMLTSCASMFIPFCNQELFDAEGGQYYGINAISHNLILINRRNSINGNGMIFGAPGSGKSVSAKQEIILVYISTDDQIIVIDPDGEYTRLAELLGGEVIYVAPGSSAHINPFDIDMNNLEEDPIVEKSGYICSLCETILSNQYGLTAGQKSIIDRCVKAVYVPYLNSRNRETGQYDDTMLPTLKTFYEELRRQDGYEAMQLADALEIYAVGSQNMFAHHSNVQYHKRFVVYNIQNIGNTMKTLGELVVLSTVWNEITKGRKEGRNVWFYIDEIYLLFKNQLSTEFLRDLYKRARKYGALVTGITQNVSDLLNNDIASTMILNSEFVLMLSQSAQDREELAQLLNIPHNLLSNITNSPPGHGLIYNGTSVVPFINEIPKDSIQYHAITTKLSEVIEIEKNESKE